MAARRQRSSGRAVVVLVVVLVVLAGVLVLADQLTRSYAEKQAATRLQSSLGSTTAPTVDIGGFPFLTQVVANRFPSADVSAAGITAAPSSAAGGIQIQSLQAHLEDVRTSGGYQRATAGRLTGQATVPYSALDAYSANPVSYAGNDASGAGRIQVTVPAPIAGDTLNVVLSGTVTVDEPNQQLVIVDPAVQVVGVDLSQQVVDALAGQFLKPIPVGALPLGLRLTGVTTTSAGVVAEVAGTDVELTGG